MKNPNPKRDWKPGDPCFFLASWSGAVTKARISEIHNDPHPYARLVCLEPAPGDTCRCLDELFLTSRDAQDAAVSASNGRRDAFESEIRTVEDLVRFGFEHCVCRAEEYTDWEARDAYKNRAKVLLGLDL